MDIFSIIGFSLAAAAVCVLLKEHRPEIAILVSVCCGVMVFAAVVVNILPVFESLNGFLNEISYESEYLSAVVKALGICYVTQFASDCCADAGQTAIASKVELAGKAAVIVISMPLFTRLIEIVSKLIELS